MLSQSIHLSFDQYDDLLALHIEKMSDPLNRPDVNKMNFERASTFEDLKNRLNCFVKNLKKGNDDFTETVNICKERMGSILKKDLFIKRKIADYQNELKHKKKMMNSGKRVLQGYGGNSFSRKIRQEPV